MKINYVIATWNGKRVVPAKCNSMLYENVLKYHINYLNHYNNNISQITIMKPISNVLNTYYDIELNDKIKIIECENRFQSYGQWLKAVELFLEDFDYFIFIEDDYVPITNNFDEKLINIYKEGTYLCSLVSGMNELYHAQISNGIISKKTIRDVIKNVNYINWITEYSIKHPDLVFNDTNHQRAFSRYLYENNINLVDYSSIYNVDFYDAQARLINYSKETAKFSEKIFTPIQTQIK